MKLKIGRYEIDYKAREINSPDYNEHDELYFANFASILCQYYAEHYSRIADIHFKNGDVELSDYCDKEYEKYMENSNAIFEYLSEIGFYEDCVVDLRDKFNS